MIKYLELSGIKVITKQEDLISSKLYILNILSKESVCKISPKDIKQSNNIYISFDHDIRQAVPKELDDIDIIIYKNHTEYYCEFFKILALLSNIDLQEFVLEFKK